MNPITELDRQMHVMQLPQLLLLFVFLTAYVTAIGRMFDTRARWRAAGVAALAAVGLCIAIQPWVLGALMVVAAIASIGLFVAATMLVSRTLGEVDAAVHAATSARAVTQPPASRVTRRPATWVGLFQRLKAATR
jgi:hypothetical protein